jgi:hypothetical protein
MMRHADSYHILKLMPATLMELLKRRPSIVTQAIFVLSLVLAVAKMLLVFSFAWVELKYEDQADTMYRLDGINNPRILAFVGKEYIDWAPQCHRVLVGNNHTADGNTHVYNDCVVPVHCDSQCRVNPNMGMYFLAPTYFLSGIYITMLGFKLEKGLSASLGDVANVLTVKSYDFAIMVMSDASTTAKFLLTALAVASILEAKTILHCEGFTDQLPESHVIDKLQSPAIVEEHCGPQNEYNTAFVSKTKSDFIRITVYLTVLFGVASCLRWQAKYSHNQDESEANSEGGKEGARNPKTEDENDDGADSGEESGDDENDDGSNSGEESGDNDEHDAGSGSDNGGEDGGGERGMQKRYKCFKLLSLLTFVLAVFGLIAIVGYTLWELDGHALNFECSSSNNSDSLMKHSVNRRAVQREQSQPRQAKDSSRASSVALPISSDSISCRACGFGYEPCPLHQFCNDNVDGRTLLQHQQHPGYEFVLLPNMNCMGASPSTFNCDMQPQPQGPTCTAALNMSVPSISMLQDCCIDTPGCVGFVVPHDKNARTIIKTNFNGGNGATTPCHCEERVDKDITANLVLMRIQQGLCQRCPKPDSVIAPPNVCSKLSALQPRAHSANRNGLTKWATWNCARSCQGTALTGMHAEPKTEPDETNMTTTVKIATGKRRRGLRDTSLSVSQRELRDGEKEHSIECRYKKYQFVPDKATAPPTPSPSSMFRVETYTQN